MKQIIIHISGPSGSGKTTLGKKLSEMYDNSIVVQDTDDLHEEFKLSKSTMSYQDYIYQFIDNNSNKPIIFVGLVNSPTEVMDMRANYKFYINISVEQNLKQRFFRSVEYMSRNKEALLEKYLKNPEEKLFYLVDLDKWKQKIESNDKVYKKYNYVFESPNKIISQIDKFLTNFIGGSKKFDSVNNKYHYKYPKHKTKYIGFNMNQYGGRFTIKKINDIEIIKKLTHWNDKKIDPYPGTVYYFYYLDDALIGYFFLQSTIGIHPVLEEPVDGYIYLWGVEILEPFRNKGYGYKMLSEHLDDDHTYFLRVHKNNLAAIKLYKELGFEFYKENTIIVEGKQIIRDIMIRRKSYRISKLIKSKEIFI